MLPIKDTDGMELISLQLFGDRVGVKRPSVIAAINSGRIVTTEKRGRPYLRWPEQRDRFLDTSRKVRRGPPSKNPAISGNSKRDAKEDDDKTTGVSKIHRDDLQYGEANALKATYDARLKKLEYEKELGNLIPAEAVRVTWQSIALSVQKAMLAIPDRIAPILAGESNISKVHKKMVNEITYALTNLEVEDGNIGTTSEQD